MSYEFTKLSNVPVVSAFPEGANAVIETNGEIKRCPSSGGGGGGVEFITLTRSGETYTANKNSEEIISIINSGKLPILIVPSKAATDQGIPTTAMYMFPFLQEGEALEASMAGFVFAAVGIGFAAVDSAGATKIMIGN